MKLYLPVQRCAPAKGMWFKTYYHGNRVSSEVWTISFHSHFTQPTRTAHVGHTLRGPPSKWAASLESGHSFRELGGRASYWNTPDFLSVMQFCYTTIAGLSWGVTQQKCENLVNFDQIMSGGWETFFFFATCSKTSKVQIQSGEQLKNVKFSCNFLCSHQLLQNSQPSETFRKTSRINLIVFFLNNFFSFIAQYSTRSRQVSL